MFQKLEEGTEYDVVTDNASRKKMSRALISYPNNKQQMIEIFQIVKVQLKRKSGTFQLEAKLVPPE